MVDLTRKLVSLPSVSADGNNGVIRFLDPFLRNLGFHVESYVGDHNNTCLIARLGGQDVRHDGLAVVAHLDTVPYKIEQEQGKWGDCNPLGGEISNGKLYGRGTADMKGPLAVATLAARRFARERLKRPFGLVLTYDEEVGHRGAKYLLSKGLLDPREFKYAIVGEPTALTPVITHPGMEETDVTVYGTGGHGSLPHLGKNAISIASRIAVALDDIGLDFQKKKHPDFDNLCVAAMNIGMMDGGEAPNMIPRKAWLKVQYRPFPIPGQKPGYVHELIKETATRIGDSYGVVVEAVHVRNDPGFEIAPNAEIVKFLQESSGQKPIGVSFSTEAVELQQAGILPVVFGPGSIYDAHKEMEFISIDQLLRSQSIFEEAIREFCMK